MKISGIILQEKWIFEAKNAKFEKKGNLVKRLYEKHYTHHRISPGWKYIVSKYEKDNKNGNLRG